MNKEDKAKKTKQDSWARRIKQAKEKESVRHEEGTRFVNYYRSRFYSATSKENEGTNGNKLFAQEPLVSVNEVFPHAVNKRDNLFFKNPECLLTSRKSGPNGRYTKLAEMITDSLPFIFQKTDIQAAMKACLLDEALTGAGFLEVGYFHPMRVVNKSELSNEDVARLHDLNMGNMGNSSLNNLIAKTSGYYDISSVDGMEGKALIPNVTYNRKIKPNMPYVLHVKWDKVFDDPEAESEDSIYWRIKEFQMPIDEIKSNYGIDVTAEPTSDNMLGTLYEVHMMYPEKKIFIISKEGEVAISTIKDYPYNVEELSIHKFSLNKIGNNECFSDVRIFEDQQLEENKLRSRQARLLDIFRNYFFFDKEIDPNTMMDIRYADDGTGIPIDTRDKKLSDVIYFPGSPPAPRDLMNELDMQISRDISRMTGQTDAQKGQATGASATENGIMQRAGEIRMSSQRDESMKYFERVVEDVIRICLQFWTPEQWAKASGGDEAEIGGLLQYEYENFKSNVDEFDFDFQVNIDSSRPINTDSVRENLTLFMQAVSNPEVMNNPMIKAVLPIYLKTFRQIVKKDEVDEIMKIVNQPPAPPPPPPPEPKMKSSMSISIDFKDLEPPVQSAIMGMWEKDMNGDEQQVGMSPDNMTPEGMGMSPPQGAMPPEQLPMDPAQIGQMANQEFNPNLGG